MKKVFFLLLSILITTFHLSCKNDSSQKDSFIPPKNNQDMIKTSDTLPPKLILNGINPVVITTKNIYQEFGAYAYDNIDGNLTPYIKITGSVNTSKPGNYNINYSVIDSSGNRASRNRSILVLSDDDSYKKNAYYVSSSGDDTQNGSFYKPFKTLQHAVNVANAGDIIYVREGTYDVGKGLIITKSGTKNNYITFTAFPGENPIITKTNTDIWSNNFGATIAFYGASYIKFNGFILKEPVGNAIFITNFDGDHTISPGSKYIEITNNSIYGQNKNVQNYLRLGYTIGVQNRKLYADDKDTESSSNILISRNYLSENYTGSLENSYNESLTIVGNVHDFIIENNILENNYFIGIDVIGHLYSPFPMNSNGLIENNLLIRNGKINQKGKRYTASLYIDGSIKTTIRNNTILDSYGIGMVISQEESASQTENITIEANYINNGALYTLGIGTEKSGLIKNLTFDNNIIIQQNQNKENFFLALGHSENINFTHNFFSIKKNLKAINIEDPSSLNTWELENNIFDSRYTFESFNKVIPDLKAIINQHTPSSLGVDYQKLVGVKKTINPIDYTPPVITLVGPNPQVLYIGSSYCEYGAIAHDAEEGDISPFIVTKTDLNTNIPGTYNVVYTVSDINGNKAEKRRTVKIIESQPPKPNKNITIDQNNITNNECPGEFIEPLENLCSYYTGQFSGSMSPSWDIDHMYFSIACSGQISISIKAKKPMTTKIGLLCDTDNFYRSDQQKETLYTFNTNGGEIINLTLFDWSSDQGYDYNISLKFVPN